MDVRRAACLQRHVHWTRSPDHWTIPAGLREHDKRCDAALLDVDGDGRQEVLVTSVDELSGHVFAQDAGGHWTRFARLDASGIDCERLRDAMTAGRVNAVTPKLNDLDLDVGGVRLRLAPPTHERGCAPRRGPAPADED